MHPLVLVGVGAGVLALLAFSARASAAGEGDDVSDDSLSGVRGIRNNNPFNLRPSKRAWQGQVGVDAGGYLMFDTPQSGIRAGLVNLRNQQKLHQLESVRAIITKYAPPSENNTDAYIAAVSRELGVDPDASLNLITDTRTLAAFGAAIIRHENGGQPYDSNLLYASAYSAIQA